MKDSRDLLRRLLVVASQVQGAVSHDLGCRFRGCTCGAAAQMVEMLLALNTLRRDVREHLQKVKGE